MLTPASRTGRGKDQAPHELVLCATCTQATLDRDERAFTLVAMSELAPLWLGAATPPTVTRAVQSEIRRERVDQRYRCDVVEPIQA